MILLTVILYVLSYLPRFVTRRFYPRLFWTWSRFFVRALGVELYLHQKNHRPLPKSYIMVANHPSAFEDVGIPALFPVFSVAKIEVRDWWIVGRIAAAAGTLFVERESKESRQAVAEQMIDELQKGKNIAIYPEGGCKGRRIFESFRYGSFDVAMRSGIPIVPVFLHYEAQERFEWQPPYTLVQKLWHILTSRNHRVNYYVYDAIEPADFSDKESFANHVHALYLKWQERYLD